MKKIIGIFALCCSILAVSCDIKTNQYQKQVSIPNAEWNSQLQPEFELEIKDTNALYDVYVLVRNDNSYAISNIWLKLHILPPGGTTFKVYDRIELSLSDASGKWLGRNFGDMWESRTLIAAHDTTIFNKPGVYKVKLEQIMRTDPLVGIVNVGINVTKK